MPEKTHLCNQCGKPVWNTIDSVCEQCMFPQEQAKGIRPGVVFERLEWYAYILKRAITNREPLTAYDACATMMGYFEQAYGHSQEREDARLVDSFDHKKGQE